MKKLLIVLLFLFSNVVADINIHAPETVNDLTIAGVYKDFRLADKEAIGKWFLQHQYPSKWDRISDNEFELHSAIADAYDTLKSISKEKFDSYINQKSIILVGIRFGKYNFKGGYFPLLGVLTKNSNVYFTSYEIGGDILADRVVVYIDNTDQIKAKLFMPMEQAKEFLDSRQKNYSGRLRDLVAKYYFTIQKIKTNIKTINEDPSNEPDLVITGHAYKVEILDSQTRNILQTLKINK